MRKITRRRSVCLWRFFRFLRSCFFRGFLHRSFCFCSG